MWREKQREAARLALATLVAAALCTCDAPANRPAASAQPRSGPIAPQRFDPASVVLGPAAPERAVFSAGDPAEAWSRAEAFIAGVEEPASLGRLRWLAARAARESDQPERARVHLEALSATNHPLAPWARLALAQLLFDLANPTPDDAERVIALLATLPDDFPGRDRAASLSAVALVRAGREDEAVPVLRALVAATDAHVGAATAGMPLAEILAARDDVSAREEALALYRRVATRAPGARVGEIAAERAEAVLRALPPDRRQVLSTIPIADRFARGEAFFNAMRHREAEAAFAELARDPETGIACEARLMQGKALLRRRQRDEGARHLEAVAESCGEPDVRTRARYLAARAHGRRGRHREALSLYDAIVHDAPSHRLADDAVYRSAFSAAALGDEASMRERFARAATEFPEGDMRGEARFHLAWHARERAARAGADAGSLFEEALSILTTSLAEGPDERGVDLRGRAAYWRARTLSDLDRTDESATAHEELARRYPLSYYAQQAIRRLEVLAPGRAASVRDAMSSAGEEPLTFESRPELETAAFARAVELLRVEEPDRALRELAAAGLMDEGADEEGLWLSAAILDRAGAHPEASLLARRRLRAFLDSAPIGAAWHHWRIAYPRAFSPLIEDAAAAEGVPATFVRAIAREESAFDPRAVSVSHAYGLIQLIRPTARRFGDELGLPSDPDALRTPEVNVRIGARFIGFLFRRYADNPAIVPSAYNAGEGASDRWLRQRGDMPLDAWIESIPYDETRRYTRRVLQTWGTYAWLDEGRLPALEERLPTR